MRHLVVFGSLLFASCAWAAEIHVAPNGNDANPGTAARPVASLERARDLARVTKGSTVILAPGAYHRTTTFELDERDSGTIYKGMPGARITGGAVIASRAVKVVSDQATLDRLLPEVRGKVLEIDLHALGITDFGEIGPRGFGRPYVPAPLELVVDGEPLTLSQWPKPGQPGEPMGKVLDEGATRRVGNVLPHGGTFAFATDRPSRWAHARDVWITGFFNNGYADDTLPVKDFDLKKKTITTAQGHGYGFVSGQPWNRWRVLNLLEEIERPGEYMADKASGKLYFLPPEGKKIASCRLEVTMMKGPLVAIEGAAEVVFDGVDIECSRGLGVYIERGANNRIQNAALRNLGTVAVCIGQGVPGANPKPPKGSTARQTFREPGAVNTYLAGNPLWNRQAGSGQGVVNCRIYNIGAGAILLGGGDRQKLEPAGNFVENCDIHRFNRWDRAYRTGVNLDGVGNIVRNCRIHDCPGGAILLHGNEHLIEYNEIDHAMLEGDDMGAFYMGRDPTERGNVFRYNYWHDLAPVHRTHGMYFDDTGGDKTTIYGNVFRKAGNNDVIFINGGSDFAIENNIFIDCKTVLRANGRDGNMRWLTQAGRFDWLLKTVRFNQSPWKEKYPEMQDYPESHKLMPRRRVFQHNLLVNSKAPTGNCKFQDNWSTKDDPGFEDAQKGNYALTPDAEAFKKIPGFKPILFDKIGLKKEK